MRSTILAALAGASIATITIATPALAQVTPAPAAAAQPPAAPEDATADSATEGTKAKDIVVTGTTIRGIAPAGANAISLSKEAIELSGATDTQGILGTLPQTNTFMAFQNPGSGQILGVSRVPINLPNLRNLPQGSLGNATTLVLMDGHRIVPSGIEQSAVDAGIVPSSIIARTEIILDGASALYGSDAAGGVINFITNKRFNGVKAAGRYGFADNYKTVDAELTAGTTWDTGGIAVTYNFAWNSPIFVKDRPNRLQRNYLAPVGTGVGNGNFTGTACEDHSTVSVGAAPNTQFFVTSGATLAPALANGGSNCASNGLSSFISGQKRHGALAAFTQDFGDNVKFDMTGLYSFRRTKTFFGPFTGTKTLTSASPYFRSLAALGVPDTTSQSVSFSYGPVLGTKAQFSTSTSELWQVTPSLSVDVGRWQVRLLAAYGESSVTTRVQSKDSTLENALLAGTTTATTINPYALASTLPTTTLGQIQSLIWTSYRQGAHKMFNLRLNADGPLFTIPGGEVTAGAGVEYLLTKFAQINTTSATHARNAPISASTKPKSVFAEINIPIFSSLNRMPGFEKLTLGGSGRYDDYNEVGTTFNYKLALTWDPINDVSLRGNYATSFRAPTAVNKIGPASNALSCSVSSGALSGCLGSGNYFILPTTATAPLVQTVGLSLIGGNDVSKLKPETAKQFTIGADFHPSFIPGLKLSASYYRINLHNVIGIPSTGANGRTDLIYTGAPQLFICGPASTGFTAPTCDGAVLTQALSTLSTLAPNNASTVLAQIAGKPISYIVDSRTTNLGGAKVGGLDAEASYIHRFSWGSADLNVNGTWRLKSTSQFFAGGAVVDELLNGTPKFRVSTTAGVRYGELRAQVTWQHQAGYLLAPAAATVRDPAQTNASATDFFNLSFRYKIKNDFKLLEDLELTATVNNVFDAKEEISRTTTGGIIGGSTNGRFVQFGISKAF